MKLEYVASMDKRKQASCLLVFVYKKTSGFEFAHQKLDLDKTLYSVLKKSEFQAKEAEVFFQVQEEIAEEKIVFVGLGEQGKLSEDKARLAAAKAMRTCMGRNYGIINVLLPENEMVLSAIIEGLVFVNYLFTKKTKDLQTKLVEVIYLYGSSDRKRPNLQNVLTISQSVFFARDLVNESAHIVTASHLVQVAKNLSKLPNVQTTVLDKRQIEQEKMGLLLAVNQGSRFDPAFIIVEYQGNKKDADRTILVGKGITYDTGGLCIKPPNGMETMREDMSGAACVLATLQAAAKLKLKQNVIAVVPTTDNAIGPNSYRPGDIYISHSGKTVEITNTDAEGRLVLADALSYVQKYLKPTRIIDVATLTGGAVVALGENMAALFSNDESLQNLLLQASKKTDERIWPMPLVSEYKEILKSEIADIKNSGNRWASAITAGLFLQEFITHPSWAHLDIAGPSYIPKEFGCYPKFATGFGIRLLIEMLQTL